MYDSTGKRQCTFNITLGIDNRVPFSSPLFLKMTCKTLNNKLISPHFKWTTKSYIFLKHYKSLIEPEYVGITIWVIILCSSIDQGHNLWTILEVVISRLTLNIKGIQYNKLCNNHASISMGIYL